MRRAWIALLAVVGVWGAEIPRAEYRTRRVAAQKALGDAVLVLFGHEDGAQEPNFYYLTGWREEGAILLLTPAGETLFLPKRNPEREKYTGPATSAEDQNARAVTGFEQVLARTQFEGQLAKALETHGRVFALKADTAKVKSLAPLREAPDAQEMLARLRAVKSAGEIERIQRSTDVTVEAHRAAWRRIAAGLYEYQIAATMTYTMLEAGCEGNAYEPIVGSGPNATVLHYAKNSRRMEAGELVLMDVGAQCASYATDVTRTVPVSGKFTARQRELYEAVLGAQKAVLAAVKPGVTMNSLRQVATEYLEAHGKLGKYLTHGVSHDVGLEVHDAPPSSYSQPLEAGMVITVEPGLYIPEEGIGIRIEDTLLVTAEGVKVLSAALPREADEIERAMAAR
ncbi:MAG: Xaa-Pro peptidase family protein [Bryobacteraceae bacterium]|jgi:Xaa-Pro aminopeptidase